MQRNVRQDASSSSQQDDVQIPTDLRKSGIHFKVLTTSLSLNCVNLTVQWNGRNLTTCLEGSRGQISSRDTQQWITCLLKGTNKIRFEYCLNQRDQIINLRAPQGHSGGVGVDPTLQHKVQILDGWTDYIRHVESTWGYRSVVDAGLLAGGKGDNQGRHTCFFTAVNPLCESNVEQSYESGQTRMVPNRMKWKWHHDAVCRFDLTIAQRVKDWSLGRRCPMPPPLPLWQHHPISAKDQAKTSPVRQNLPSGHLRWLCVVCAEIWIGDVLVCRR